MSPLPLLGVRQLEHAPFPGLPLPLMADPDPLPHDGVTCREMLTKLGPSFIKAGQVLANRPDIVRQDFMDELCVLQVIHRQLHAPANIPHLRPDPPLCPHPSQRSQHLTGGTG